MLGILDRFSAFLHLSKEETKKILWLSVSFFCVIGAYTILKEMKDSLFVTLAAVESMHLVKLTSLLVLVPATLLYARLVDVMKRSRLIWFYVILYSVVGLIITLLLPNASFGLLSPAGSFGRTVFGWFIYLFYEGANPFIVSLFWSYANSITPPQSAKNGYAIMISGSKLGGMTTAGTAWLLFSYSSSHQSFTDVMVYQCLLGGASLLLLVAPYIIYQLHQSMPEESMHGYEAAYKADQSKTVNNKKTGILSGLKMFAEHPYIFGIFGMIFFYELINVILAVQRLAILQGGAKSLSGFNESLFLQRFTMHAIGIMISFFGTRVLISRLGERICLLLIPIFMSVLLFYFMVSYNEQAVLIVFMALGIINYAFSSPLRESLYIPTVRDIRFKSKAWIDSFGTKFSKGFGVTIIGVVNYFNILGTPLFATVYSIIFTVICSLWIILAYFLGKKFENLVKTNKVIGS